MSQLDYVDACSDLLVQLASIEPAEGGISVSYEAVVTSLDQVVSSSGSDLALSNALSVLTRYVAQAYQSGTGNTYHAALLAILADATKKNPVWRSLFGLCRRQEDEKSTCILDVAQEIVGGSSSQDRTDVLESALRLIANCCADNNRNRKHFLSRSGLEALISHLIIPSSSDLLIPTIYNVCNDYEDPDLEAVQSSVAFRHAPGDQAGIEEISFAAEKLAAVCIDRQDFTTFELLLAPLARPSIERLGFLAGLVELAALPATEDISNILGNRASIWRWSFVHCYKEIQTLEAANELASHSTECRVSVLRAVLYVLSRDEARRALLERHDGSILQLVRLAIFPLDSDDLDDFEDETSACRKEFFKIFYSITGMPEFSGNEKANILLVESCLDVLSENSRPLKGSGSESMALESPIMRSCCLVIVAQLSIQNQLRQRLLNSETLLDTVSTILNTDNTVEMVYPAITLVTSLALSPQASHVLLTEKMLQGMKRLTSVGGLGLAVPYETIHAFRLLFKGRSDCLVSFTHDPGDGSIISHITTLFDRTFEAGTKLEVGSFFIELLRTIFPLFKNREVSESNPEDIKMLNAFDTLMTISATKIAEIFTFVCMQAEPKEQRVHGWFGLGMLSVWSQGRLAIVNAIEFHSLDRGILEVASMQEGMAKLNLKLMVSKMQLCSKEDLPEKTRKLLNEEVQI